MKTLNLRIPKRILRPFLTKIFAALKLYEWTGALNKCVILKYHSVQKDGCGDGSYVSPGVSISRHDFDVQMEFLSP